MADKMLRIAGRDEDGLAKALSVTPDDNGNGVLRTVDAAPVAYDSEDDSLKVQLVRGQDQLRLERFSQELTDFYIHEKVKKGILGDFETRLNTPVTLGQHAKMVYGGNGYIYAILEPYASAFYRYSIIDDTWETVANIPGTTFGTALIYTGDKYIYAVQGNGLGGFFRYDILANTWTTLTAPPSAWGFGGSTLGYAGGDIIYAFKGNGSNEFWAYSISGNTWSTLSNVPDVIRVGSNIVCAEDGDVLFVTLGSAGSFNNKKLFKYTISTNAWVALADMPDVANGSLSYSGYDYLIATKGFNTSTTWKYNIITNQWSKLKTPAITLGSGSSQFIYVGNGYNFSLKGTGSNIFWRVPYKLNNHHAWMK